MHKSIRSWRQSHEPVVYIYIYMCIYNVFPTLPHLAPPRPTSPQFAPPYPTSPHLIPAELANELGWVRLGLVGHGWARLSLAGLGWALLGSAELGWNWLMLYSMYVPHCTILPQQNWLAKQPFNGASIAAHATLRPKLAKNLKHRCPLPMLGP